MPGLRDLLGLPGYIQDAYDTPVARAERLDGESDFEWQMRKICYLWSLKSYDGREKSLLRGAAADLLPQSVVERVKSPYPSTQDPAYTVSLQNNAREYLSSPGHPVFDIISRGWLATAIGAEAQITQASRRGLERALDLALWLDMYKPVLKLS